MPEEIFFPHIPEPNPTVREHLLNGGICIFDNITDTISCRTRWIWVTARHLIITKHKNMYHVKFDPEWLKTNHALWLKTGDNKYDNYPFSWDNEPSLEEKNKLIAAEIIKLNEYC